MGMDREAPHGSAFAPGLHAAANCLPAMVNVEVEAGVARDGSARMLHGLHRSHGPASAGATSQYTGIRAFATRDIPQGGELLFVDYGDSWFVSRNMTNVTQKPYQGFETTHVTL